MIKKILFAAGLLVAAPAMATPPIPAPTDLTLTNAGGVHGSYYGLFHVPVAAGAFTDTFTFQLPSPLYNLGSSFLTSVGTDVALNGTSIGSSGIGLTNFNLNFKDGSTSLFPVGTNTFGQVVLTSVETLSKFSDPKAVRGGWTNYVTVSGLSGGVNSFDLYITASYAVPEPEAWALMIAGFALIGGLLVLRRRREEMALKPA
jgi:hypothetical protein